MSRIKIFTGHFGSGKTEIAINYAVKKAKEGKKVLLVDIDTVSPYFCSREHKNELQSKYGIRVISSNQHLVNAELMVVPGEVLSAFNDKSCEVIFDVGGDYCGAATLGQFNTYFKDEPYDMYFVINNLRPFTSNNSSAEEHLKLIERSSRLKVTHIISNANLLQDTKKHHILKGEIEAFKLSKRLNIPYRYTVCVKGMENEIADLVQGEILSIDLFIRTSWN